MGRCGGTSAGRDPSDPHHDREGFLMSRTRIPLSRQDEQTRLMKERLEMSTAEIGLTVRTTNCLEERGIFTVRDLLNSTPEQLLSIANFGEKTLEEVYKALERIGFYRASRQKAMA
jgi:DNA-directed RNA polymerase subunit alpha